jgi:hypothetical protein
MVTKPKGGWDEGVVCCGRSNPQRSLFAIRFGDENATHGLRLVRLPSQVIRQFVQPLRDAVRLDVRERLAIDPRRATVGAAAVEGEVQDVATVHLVVKRVEAIAGRSLRFGMQRLLEFPNLFRRCEAHANLLVLVLCRTSVLNSGSFPPPALTGFLGTTSLSATPVGLACPSRASSWESRAPTEGGFPCCISFPFVVMPSPIPRWDRWIGSFRMRGSQPLGIHQRRRPSPYIWRVGSHVKSFEACSVFTRVTA